jgi:hypothetical protein
MAWTTPATSRWISWLHRSLNTHLRDNLNALKSPPSARYEANESSDYTTTSAGFADVDSTNFALTITIAGNDVFLGFTGVVAHSVGVAIFFDVLVDGITPVAGNDGMIRLKPTGAGQNYSMPVSFTWLVTGLAVGQHTFKLQWKTASGTATLYAGAGTSGADVHPQFWAREMS